VIAGAIRCEPQAIAELADRRAVCIGSAHDAGQAWTSCRRGQSGGYRAVLLGALELPKIFR
jgi:hypothetical protein